MSYLKKIAIIATASVAGAVLGGYVGNEIGRRRTVAYRKALLEDDTLVEPLQDEILRTANANYSAAVIILQRTFDRMFLQAYPMIDRQQYHDEDRRFAPLMGLKLKRKSCSLMSAGRRVLIIEVTPGNNFVVYQPYRNSNELQVHVSPAICEAYKLPRLFIGVDNENVEAISSLLTALDPHA